MLCITLIPNVNNIQAIRKLYIVQIIKEDRMISLFNTFMCWKTITIAFPFAISIDIYLIIK